MARRPARSSNGVRRARLVTLTTDVGSLYAAQIKGVLLRVLPPGHVVDITHDIPAHAVEEAAFLISHIGPVFPPGTVHVVVVDPGVGGARAPIVVACADGSLLVGPDNGVLSPLAERLGRPRAYRLDAAKVGPAPGPRSVTFDGRDLFAPAAARIALGEPPERLGKPQPLRRLVLPTAKRSSDGARGAVVHVDRFGNLISNIPGDWVPRGLDEAQLRPGRSRLRTLPIVRTYEELPRVGAIGVLVSSFGLLEVAARERSASRALRVGVGSPLTIEWRRRDRDRK